MLQSKMTTVRLLDDAKLVGNLSSLIIRGQTDVSFLLAIRSEHEKKVRKLFKIIPSCQKNT